jgi:hypothetical protein
VRGGGSGKVVPRQVTADGLLYGKRVKDLSQLLNDDELAAEEAAAQGGVPGEWCRGRNHRQVACAPLCQRDNGIGYCNSAGQGPRCYRRGSTNHTSHIQHERSTTYVVLFSDTGATESCDLSFNFPTHTAWVACVCSTVP